MADTERFAQCLLVIAPMVEMNLPAVSVYAFDHCPVHIHRNITVPNPQDGNPVVGKIVDFVLGESGHRYAPISSMGSVGAAASSAVPSTASASA